MEDTTKITCAGIYVFEGIDNVGKTTIIQKLKQRICETTEYNCINIAFPGNEPRTLGSLVYDIHHRMGEYFDVPISDVSLQLMHVAAHIDMIQREIVSLSKSSNIILMDRFWWSTYAYGLVGTLGGEEIVQAILTPELMCWKSISIKKIFLLERENREREYEADKDAAIVHNYRELAKGEPKCRTISNNGRLDETIAKIYESILGE